MIVPRASNIFKCKILNIIYNNIIGFILAKKQGLEEKGFLSDCSFFNEWNVLGENLQK